MMYNGDDVCDILFASLQRIHSQKWSTLTKTCLFKNTENFTTKKRRCLGKKMIFFIFLLKTARRF